MKDRDRNKFVIRILLLIGLFLLLLLVNIDDVINLSSNKNYSKKELVVNNNEIVDKNVNENEEIVNNTDDNKSDVKDESENKNKNEKENLEETSEDESKIENKLKEPKDALYIKNSNLKVYGDTNTAEKAIDTLSKGVRIKKVEEKDVILKKDKKSKDSAGKTVIVKVEETVKWEKIEYKKNQKTLKGWVMSGNLTDNYHELLPTEWKELDFSEIPKHDYPNNPRIDVRGIYVSANSAGLSSRVDNLIALSKRTGINAFVIDVKNDDGYLLFNMEFAEKYSDNPNKNIQIKDIEAFMAKMKENNIYTIARIVSFKDPAYARKNPNKVILNKTTKKPHTDSDKVVWVSPHDRNLWEYNIKVSQEAARVGFNEIQFDYVRFPATGGGKADINIDYRNTKNESKPLAIQNYLKYAREHLEPLEVYIAADVYGQIGSLPDDMKLGQYWESVSNVVDYICPMVYPSHFGPGVYGLPVPDAEPYKTIYYSVRDEINRNENIDSPSMIRPWLQLFTARWVKGSIKYGYDQVQAQVKALADLGIKNYILWSPTNTYTVLDKNSGIKPDESKTKNDAKKSTVKQETKSKPSLDKTQKAKEIVPNAEPKVNYDEKKEDRKPATSQINKEEKKVENKGKPRPKLIDRFKKVTR
ncbi:putative glycoside hydrolase [Fusobacterium sp. PH5-44]|uniref:putative glycoside hydrolase n=1 Tax=unclassified Fusobacterium TaxID=2648384 RepID=UPI003D1DED41